jgi:putative superfamily III holin-X
MEEHMLVPSSNLLRAGLGLKLNQIKLATRSYVRDRTNQATGTVTSYAVAGGLFAAAGLFLIAACLVGMTALFRWVEINYGLFYAFGVVGGLLLLIAIICAGFAMMKLKRRRPDFPSLTSRLRVAALGTVSDPGKIEASLAPSASRSSLNPGRPTTQRGATGNNRDVRAGLILAATLLGWVAARRRRQAREM